MPFKKHNWMDYSSQGDIVEITIKDWTGRRLDFLRCNIKSDSNTIINILKKYGFNQNDNDLKKEIEEEKNFLEKEREKINSEKENFW